MDLMNILKILALAGSICCVSQGSEAPGGSTYNGLKIPGGSGREGTFFFIY